MVVKMVIHDVGYDVLATYPKSLLRHVVAVSSVAFAIVHLIALLNDGWRVGLLHHLASIATATVVQVARLLCLL